MTETLRTLRTLRHLTAGQVYARALHEIRLGVYRGAAPFIPRLYPPDASARIEQVRLVLPPTDLGRQLEIAERWRQGRVEYLGSEGDRGDWHAGDRPKLWRYERQYHAELVSLARLSVAEPGGPWLGEARLLLEQWSTACQPGPGDAWEPYPVARRILNWSLAVALAPGLASFIAPRLAMQLRFLRSHLERHLLGNHLLCDAAALVAGAAMLATPDAPAIGAFGASLLAAELHRQVLGDGGYAERTAQYHALVLRDALVALALGRLVGHDVAIEPELARMARWLFLARRCEGSLPHLNDATADAGHFASEAVSLGQAAGLPWAVEHDHLEARGDVLLGETGWSFIRADNHELLFEHGPIGPPEQPGHGHSDALSYELLWNGAPVVTDSGVTTYEVGPVREFERSARAHATVTVDGAGPDELWGSFRVGGRGRVEAEPTNNFGHDLRVLRARVHAHAGWQHDRRLLFWPGKALVVFDRVRNARPGSEVLSRIPLDPEWTFQRGEGTISLRGPRNLELALTIVHGEFAGASTGTTDPREGWVSRGFGRPVARPSLRLRCDAAGRCCYAIAGPGSVVERIGSRYVLRSAAEALALPLEEDDPVGMPA